MPNKVAVLIDEEHLITDQYGNRVVIIELLLSSLIFKL